MRDVKEATMTNSIDVKASLSYDPATGVFRWKVGRPGTSHGAVAGSRKVSGYLSIGLGGKEYLAHRLAWWFATGAWPTGQIDHINGDRADNLISNLRDVSPQVNQQNRSKAQKNTRAGLLGVTWHSRNRKFQALIRVNGKQRFLGQFDTAEQAHAAYIEAKRQLHTGCTI
jgi:hypothetical protein